MILRTTHPNGYQVNYWLGQEYHWISAETNKQDFDKTMLTYFGDNEAMSEDCYGFIIYNFAGGKMKTMPFYKAHYNSIWCPDGTLFEKK